MSALYDGEWSASRFSRFSLGERVSIEEENGRFPDPVWTQSTLVKPLLMILMQDAMNTLVYKMESAIIFQHQFHYFLKDKVI